MNILTFKNRLLLALCFIFACTAVVVGGVVSAQDVSQENAERITLSPALSRPSTAETGSVFSGSLKIINDGTVDYDFTLYARPFSVKGEQYEPNYDEVTTRTEAYQWVQFEKTKFHLKAGERVDVTYSVTVPSMATPGGHYAVLFAETQPTNGATESVVRKKRVGSLLYMTVSGDIKEKGSLVGVDAQGVQTKKPIRANLRVKNDGNVHYMANIRAYYQDLFGAKKFQLNQEAMVLPETVRAIPMTWESAPYFGIFKTGGTVEFLGKTEKLPQKYIVLIPKSLIVTLSGVALLAVVYLVVKRKFHAKASRTKKSDKK
jgi:hypothetical protein